MHYSYFLLDSSNNDTVSDQCYNADMIYLHNAFAMTSISCSPITRANSLQPNQPGDTPYGVPMSCRSYNAYLLSASHFFAQVAGAKR